MKPLFSILGLHFPIPRKSQVKLLVTALMLVQGSQHSCKATSIVILINSEQIVVSADSLKNENGRKVKMCKIFKSGSIYWAISGIWDFPPTKYSIAEIVKRSSAKGTDVEGMLKAVEVNSVKPLVKALQYELLMEPRAFETVRYHPLEIAFWTFRDGKPVIASVDYSAKLNGRKVILVKDDENIWDCARDNCSTQTHAQVLGVRTAIVNYTASHSDWSRQSLVTIGPKFVSLAIVEQSATVGPPINTLVITQSGDKWISPNECCYESPGDPLIANGKRK
jgi:hypothetical protein